ncbi:phytase [Altericroceibacterium endophyticum]|uniref:Phytase n=1 Tax=Altericroceibacterium endophyticum TaxID=1808508 RepID=A0A6I4T8F7_9SPHN|nr:phytase [Altericroceibacterium endophyticum]MXO67216.1 phytase [Altericroceibacterium endophyticum]
MRLKTTLIALGASTAACALAACATTAPINAWPAVTVTAVAETDPVGTANEDAADDPAIWRDAADPAKSLVVATDKRAGLIVYDLTGKTRFTEDSGRINNVDLADMGEQGVIVVASDRNDPAQARLGVWRLNTDEATLTKLGSVPGGEGEGYGLCVWKNGSALQAYSVLKDGTVAEFAINVNGADVSATPLRTLRVSSQSEGCVVDPRDGTFYLGEENVGIWRFAPGATQGELVAPIDNLQLVADVEGLALLPQGEKAGWLVASSQGDNAYAVYDLTNMAPVGRFRIAAGRYGSTEETDGIELKGGSFGPDYPDGLFIAQDGMNGDRAQNFKYASWADIRDALYSR